MSVEAEECIVTESPLEIRISELTGPIAWADLFGNGNPVEIEIGSGKGRFVVQSALAHSTINYVGIERSLHYFRILRDRAVAAELSNVRLLRDDAGYLMQKFIPDNSVEAYHIYFPDPWPKNRHRKRRLIQPAFLTEVWRTLTPGGTFDFATDHEGYYEWIAKLLSKVPELKPCDAVPVRVADLGSGITNFEAKYISEGRPIYRGAVRKPVNRQT